MKLQVVDAKGAEVREIEADDAVFGLEPNLPVVHQAALAQLANARQGTNDSLDRSEPRAANTKSRRQKGTGRARMGSPSSPTRVGGAVAHGPHPRSYRQALPKRMRRLAIRSMLSQRASEGGLIVLDDATEFEARTQALDTLAGELGIERSALFVTAALDDGLRRATRNLPGIDSTPADTLNVLAVLNHDQIVMTEAAIQRVQELWGGERATSRRAPVAAAESAD